MHRFDVDHEHNEDDFFLCKIEKSKALRISSSHEDSIYEG